MAIAIADRLISKGLKQEDVSKVISEMSSYYNRLNMLRNKIINCRACSLADKCHSPIAGLGPLQPEIVVVSDHPLTGEYPGMIETSIVMMTLFSRIGLKVEDIYWTHAVKCRTERVKMSHIKDCYMHLHNEIVVLQPAAIVALGGVAISSLAGEHVSIEDAIQGEFEFDAGTKSIPVFPVYHPRSLIDLPDKEFKAKMNKMWVKIRDIVDYL